MAGLSVLFFALFELCNYAQLTTVQFVYQLAKRREKFEEKVGLLNNSEGDIVACKIEGLTAVYMTSDWCFRPRVATFELLKLSETGPCLTTAFKR
jgi:hypothetical protein